MKGADPLVPSRLFSLQQWFGKSIVQPLVEGSFIQSYTEERGSIAEEAAHYIRPSPTLQPHQCLELYNQQYWWRLIRILKKTYPLLCRLFTSEEFSDEIAVPYLKHHPPAHWSLTYLGQELPQWLEKNFHAENQQLLIDCARIDWGYEKAFSRAHYPFKVDQGQLQKTPLQLQPHLSLFTLPYDLFSFRDRLLEEEENYWEEHSFPQLAREGPYSFVLYRNCQQQSLWERVEPAEGEVLKLISHSLSLPQLCQLIEEEREDLYEQAVNSFQDWFAKWTQREWLSLNP